jgi:hypothetical protein
VTSGVRSAARNRSLLIRREAITMKILNAVSLNANPAGRFSANIPTIVSTFSTSPS